MYTLDIRTVYNNKADFYKELVKANVQDLSTLNKISNEIKAENTYHIYRVPFLHYLIENIPSNRLLEKLSCMSTYLADEGQFIIFKYCLKILDSQQDLYDVQVQHLVYSLLEKCDYTNEIWESEYNKLAQKTIEKKLELYDIIMEEYLYNPRNYPQEVHLDNDSTTITLSSRLLLFNLIYSSNMRPIKISNDQSLFKLSDECTYFIKEQARYRDSFIIETQLIDTSLRHPERNILFHTSKKLDDGLKSSIVTVDTVDIIFRECCNLLIHAPKFAHTLTMCLIQLLQFTKQSCKDEYNLMCQAAWLKIFQSLLNDVVFLDTRETPLKMSTTISTLSQCCACFIQLNHYTQNDGMNTNHIEAIWSNFIKKRNIYLNSTHTTDPDLPWLQHILYMTTANNYDE